MTHYYLFVASTYGAGAYNVNNYNGTSTSTSTSGTGSSLSNTGIAVAGIVTIAAVILLVAMVVRIWRRPSKKAQPVPVETDGSADK